MKTLDQPTKNKTDQAIDQVEEKPKTRQKGKNNKTPMLVCNLTGVSRYTNMDYLKTKASRLKTDVDTILKHYVCRDVLKCLIEGKGYDEIQEHLGITYDSPLIENEVDIEEVLKMNGKQKKDS